MKNVDSTPVNNALDPLVNEHMVASLAGVSVQTVRRWRREKQAPPFVVISRHCIRYRVTDLQSWLDSLPAWGGSATEEGA